MKAYDQKRTGRVWTIERKQRDRLRNRVRILKAERKTSERLHNRASKHLYVMAFVEFPGIYKIGRSGDVAARRRAINGGLFLTLQVLAIYENAGHLELRVHDLLAPYLVMTGNSREWFKCSVEHIHQTVMSVINSNSALSPEGDPLSPSGAPIRLVEH